MPSDNQIVLTRPCTDAPGRFIAEASFGRPLDMAAACARVRGIPGARCSESLGIARLDFKDWTFILYRSGRIDLRKVRDEEDARRALEEMERLLEGAFI